MINLERKIGPMRLRAWLLVLNMLANAIALYGLSRVLNGVEGGATGWPVLILGIVLTVGCIAVCARPAQCSGENAGQNS